MGNWNQHARTLKICVSADTTHLPNLRRLPPGGGSIPTYSNFFNPKRLAVEEILEVIRTSLLTCKRGTRVKTNLASAGVSWCLLTTPRVPQPPARLDRGQQPPRACPGGDQGLRTHLSNFHGLSILSPQLLTQQPIFRSKGICLAVELC